jgi:hypothetical protein
MMYMYLLVTIRYCTFTRVYASLFYSNATTGKATTGRVVKRTSDGQRSLLALDFSSANHMFHHTHQNKYHFLLPSKLI